MPPPMHCIGLVIPIPMARHKNIPIFIAHKGCPNQCVFCNQKTIAEEKSQSLDDIKKSIESALSFAKKDDEMEIAFFGGSFTGIPREEMCSLLELAKGYLDIGKIVGIRLSTRPDYISNEILDILAHYGVTDIELGVQSLSDKVLSACHRGHTAQTTLSACRMIRQYGAFRLVGQMMLGLPDATKDDEMATAKILLGLPVDAIRIYPTVVLQDTALANTFFCGDYTPLSVEEAVKRAADILEMAIEKGIPCLRIGLCENESLHSENGMVAGAFHPAMGELVFSELYLRRMTAILDSTDCKEKEIQFIIPEGSLSMAVGHKKSNLHRLYELYRPKRIRFTQSKDLKSFEIFLQEDHTIAPYITGITGL